MHRFKFILIVAVVTCGSVSTGVRVGLGQTSTSVEDSDTERVVAEIKAMNADVVKKNEEGKYEEAIEAANNALLLSERQLGLDHLETAAILNGLANAYCSQRNFAKALPLYERALKIREKGLGPDHPDTAESLNGLGELYFSEGNYAEAQRIYERALKIRERVLGGDHPDTAESLHNLAAWYESQSNFAEALPLYERALRIKEKTVGPDHPDTASSLNNLATLYFSQDNYSRALPLFQRALKIHEKSLEPGHPTVATSLNNLAFFYFSQDNYAEALPLYLRALEIREKVLGPDHPDTASSLNNLADLYYSQSNLAEALPLYERTLRIREKTLGPDHPNTASSLYRLAVLYDAQDNHPEALPLYERALRIREKALGFDHPTTATTLHSLAVLYDSQGNYKKAFPLYQRALKIREKTLGPDHPDTAAILNDMAASTEKVVAAVKAMHADVVKKIEERNFDQAIEAAKNALFLSEQTLEPDHPETATTLHNLALLYKSQGNYEEAVPLEQRALNIREKSLGFEHPVTAQSLQNLASLYEEQANYADALPLYQRAFKTFEKALGPDHPLTAESLNDLAGLYYAQANYTESLPLFLRALQCREKTLGPDHPDTAVSLHDLAVLYHSLGNYAEALPLHQQALKIREKAFGPDHPNTASSLNSLASVYASQGNYPEAVPLYERAFKIRAKTLGPDNFRVADILNNLAIVYHFQGNYAESLSLHKRALMINQSTFGPDHPNTASSLSNLAALYYSQDAYPAALLFFQGALKIREKTLGPNHPDTARSLLEAGIVSEASGDENGRDLFHRCIRSIVAHNCKTLPSLNANEQELFLKELFNTTFRAALSQAFRHPDQAATSASWPLNSKGIVLDVLSAQELVSRDINDPKFGTVVSALQNARHQLAVIAMKAVDSSDQAKRRETIDRLNAEVDRLSRELAQATGSQIFTGNWIELDDLRNALPQDAVFVDIARFDVYNFEAKGREAKWGDAHYAAWITPAAGKGEVRLIDLGLASEIDTLIEPIRKAMEPGAISSIETEGEDVATKALNASMQKLADRVWNPIKPLIGDSRQIILSPDGALWLVPWNALPVDSGDQMLIEKYSLRLVTSGREILNPKTTKLTVNSPLIFADPNFDSTGSEKRKSIEAILKAPPKADDETLRGFSAKSLLPKVKRLPNTASEAKFIQPSIAKLTGSTTRVFESQYALESIAKKVRRPKVAVFATHGFFMPTQAAKKDDRLGMGLGDESRSIALDTEGKPIENPLLRCGLLLAGCNNRDAVIGDDDGILTGMEIVGIDFRGTELVVLSACETGVGDIKSGEGVAGLRQAFQLAGAKAVVASLWQVPDRDSAIIMNDFFFNMATGSTAAEAMRQSQLKRIEARRRQFGAAHPFYWAAWTVTE